MPTQDLKFFNDYFKHSIGDAEGLYLDFLGKEAVFTEQKAQAAMTMMPLVTFISARLEQKKYNDMLWIFDANIARIIEAPLFVDFYNNPQDVDVQEELAMQLLMVASAMGYKPNGVVTYGVDEWKKIVKGEVGFAHPADMLLSIRENIDVGADYEVLVQIMAFAKLSMIDDTVPDTLPIEWGLAVMRSALIQAGWKMFESLDVSNQQMLLTRFFYKAAVVGVPLREILLNAVNSSTLNKDTEAARLLQSIKGNLEFVPVQTNFSQVLEFNRLYSQVALTERGSSGSLEIDELCKRTYVGQAERDFYASTLREALTAAQVLQKN